MGYECEQLAYVPLIESDAHDASGAVIPGVKAIRLSSLLATADAGVEVGGIDDTGMRVGQLFATGEAATALARHGSVRRVLGPAIVSNFEEVAAFAARHASNEARTAGRPASPSPRLPLGES